MQVGVDCLMHKFMAGRVPSPVVGICGEKVRISVNSLLGRIVSRTLTAYPGIHRQDLSLAQAELRAEGVTTFTLPGGEQDSQHTCIGRRHGETIFQDLRNVIRFCTWNGMKWPSQTTRCEMAMKMMNAPVHCARGPAACTTTASDEAKARTETKAAVEMAYMVKQRLRQRVLL